MEAILSFYCNGNYLCHVFHLRVLSRICLKTAGGMVLRLRTAGKFLNHRLGCAGAGWPASRRRRQKQSITFEAASCRARRTPAVVQCDRALDPLMVDTNRSAARARRVGRPRLCFDFATAAPEGFGSRTGREAVEAIQVPLSRP